MRIVGNHPNEEIQKMSDNYEEIYSELEANHKEVIMLIKDEAQFEEEERWIEQCHETFLRLKIDAQDYMKQEAQGPNTEMPAAKENDALTPNEGTENIGEIPATVLTKKD